MGITWAEFWNMTPAIIEAYKKGFRIKKDEQNTFAYIQGAYFRDAIACTVGNMFKKKGTKAIEYPDKPYDLYGNVTDGDGMSESEKRKQTELLFARLQTLKDNYDLSKQQHIRGDE